MTQGGHRGADGTVLFTAAAVPATHGQARLRDRYSNLTGRSRFTPAKPHDHLRSLGLCVS
jgi:hypothetical protein